MQSAKLRIQRSCWTRWSMRCRRISLRCVRHQHRWDSRGGRPHRGATAAETPVLRPCPPRPCMHAYTACTSHTVPLLSMLQVMASQKQMEAKFKQAQATAVSVVDLTPTSHSSVPGTRIAAYLPASCGCTLCGCLGHPCTPQLRHITVTPHSKSTALALCCCTFITPPQDDWLKRAELAVSKGEDELAREALKRRKAYQVSQGSKTASSGAGGWWRNSSRRDAQG